MLCAFVHITLFYKKHLSFHTLKRCKLHWCHLDAQNFVFYDRVPGVIRSRTRQLVIQDHFLLRRGYFILHWIYVDKTCGFSLRMIYIAKTEHPAYKVWIKILPISWFLLCSSLIFMGTQSLDLVESFPLRHHLTTCSALWPRCLFGKNIFEVCNTGFQQKGKQSYVDICTIYLLYAIC